MLSKTNRNPMLRSLATAEDYKGKTFKNKNLILFELWRANFEATGDIMIKDVSFENCHIDGPAVLLPINGCVFDDTNFGTAHGDMRNLVLHPASPQRITGAIAMVNCTFNAVDFFAVGFTGNKDFLESLLQVETREGDA
jgi:hypothetical protein